MNVMSVLNQIMGQAQGGQSHSSGGMDINSLMGSLGNQVSGGNGGRGIDVNSLLGGGALGLMLGSKGGRKMGGTALKYDALAGVGALARKAYQNYQSNAQGAPDQAPAQQGRALEQ